MDRKYGKQQLDKMNRIDQDIRKNALDEIYIYKKRIEELERKDANGDDVEEELQSLKELLKSAETMAYDRD